MRTELIGVNVLHGAVKFRYDNGQARLLNDAEAVEFHWWYEKEKRHFADARKARIHVAKKHFH